MPAIALRIAGGCSHHVRLAARLRQPHARSRHLLRIPIEGEITGEVVEQTRRRVERAIRAHVNLLVLDLKCTGGDPGKAYELGLYLANLNEKRGDNPVETIAYVTNKVRNLVAFLAFSCNKIVMQLEEGTDDKDAEDDEGLPREARLGGFDLFLRRAERPKPNAPPADEELARLTDSLRDNLADLASRQSYPPILAVGMFSPRLRIWRVERAVGAGGQAFLSEEDFKADQAGPKQWRGVDLVKPWKGQAKYENRPLKLTARQARELGVAQAVVKDFSELCDVEGLTLSQVRTSEADWLDGLADFLRDPWTSVVLVMLGITCLILELKMPGVGLPGVIAAICFVLFFWAHSQLNGQLTWLAILLFMLGLLLIGLEVFVLPGFGVCGIAGTLLVFASLGLVAYGHWPRSTQEWVLFGHKLMPFSASMVGSMVLVIIVARYLPHIPILNRLMHRPAEDTEDADREAELPLHAELQCFEERSASPPPRCGRPAKRNSVTASLMSWPRAAISCLGPACRSSKSRGTGLWSKRSKNGNDLPHPGAFLIGIGFLLMLADLFLGSGVMFMLALASMLVGIVFVFKHDTTAGLYALAGVGLAVPASAWILLRVGPLRRMVTADPPPDDTIADLPNNQELEKLRGRVGKTISSLRPAGVVDFDGRRVDSLTEGMMIEPGQWVRCIEVSAGRVIVRRTDQTNFTDLETAIFK